MRRLLTVDEKLANKRALGIFSEDVCRLQSAMDYLNKWEGVACA